MDVPILEGINSVQPRKAQAHEALYLEPDRSSHEPVWLGNSRPGGTKRMDVLGHGVQLTIKWSVN